MVIGAVASDLFFITGFIIRDLDDGTGALLLAGLAGHALVGPIVHWANGEGARGAGSLALNVGLPALGFVLGSETCFTRNEADGACESFAGIIFLPVLGAVLATSIDIATLPYKSVAVPPPGSVSKRDWVVAPIVSPSSLGLQFATQL